jgi:hypothetical protein
LFGAAWINRADFSIGHPKGTEVCVISIAKRGLIFEAFTHAALPSGGGFYPGVFHVRSFFISQFDVEFNGLAR